MTSEKKLRIARATLTPVWVCEDCLQINTAPASVPDEETVREAAGIQPWEHVDVRQWATIPKIVACASCEAEFKLSMSGPGYPEDEEHDDDES